MEAFMGLEGIKSAIKDLPAKERRQVALYILELEKENVQKNIGPQIAEDVDAVSRVAQDAIQKLKNLIDGIR
jgi:DNA-directed RNA polymerase specialized sigma subunit